VKSWVWRHLHVALPDDWEMLRFSRDVEQGSCLFADRGQYRLELSWRQVPAAPDFPRMMDDYIERLKEEDADGRMRLAPSTRPGGWHGVEGVGGHAAHSRYGAWLTSASILVELVFFWPDRCDAALRDAILASVREAEPTAAGRLRWEAAGLRLVVEPELMLETCEIQPASVNMVFAIPEKDRVIRRFQRLGMVDRWLAAGVDTWLLGTLRRSVTVMDRTTRRVQDHTVFRVRGRRRKRGLGVMSGRWLAVDAAAWRCPHDGRIYCSQHDYPLRGRGEATHPDRQLACCQAWEAGDG